MTNKLGYSVPCSDEDDLTLVTDSRFLNNIENTNIMYTNITTSNGIIYNRNITCSYDGNIIETINKQDYGSGVIYHPEISILKPKN